MDSGLRRKSLTFHRTEYYHINDGNSDQSYAFSTTEHPTNAGYVNNNGYSINHDTMGNMISSEYMGNDYILSYNAENQLKTSMNGIVKYRYNSDGLLQSRVGESLAEVGTQGYSKFEDTEYIYDENDQLVVEIDNFNNSMKKYVRSIDGEISKVIDEDNAVLNYFVYNLRGDVFRLTNGSGTVTATYKYDAYGQLESSLGNDANDNSMLYCGEYFDDYTDCYYLRARYYNPVLMRFMQQDTYLGDQGSPASRNLYTYCSNDPINNCDPTGHWRGKIHKEITEKVLTSSMEKKLEKNAWKYVKSNNDFKKKTRKKEHNKFLKRFVDGILSGCTLPDDERETYHDGNDTPSGYWHGGEKMNIYMKNSEGSTYLDVEVNNCLKELTLLNYKKAGELLGCILHAVQDVQAHQYNEDIRGFGKSGSFDLYNEYLNNSNNFAKKSKDKYTDLKGFWNNKKSFSVGKESSAKYREVDSDEEKK